MNLLVNALKLVHCRGVPGKRDGRNGKLSCTCGWRPEPDLVEKKCPSAKVFLVHLRLQERKAVERVTGCVKGRNLQDWKWLVCWLVVRSEKCPGTKVLRCSRVVHCAGPRLESWGVHRMTRRGPGKPCGESENPVTICTLCLLRSLSVRPSMNWCRPEESLILF